MAAFSILMVGLFLAYANGANDNFKGVATLFGSGSSDYKKALLWGTVTTFAGSITALYLAQTLLVVFSGKGLVPDEVVALKSYSTSVGLSTALTVMFATRLGFPVSTTHALIGGLIGAGLLASPEGVNFAKLASGFFLPLLVSPFVSIFLAFLLYPVLRTIRKSADIKKESCICVSCTAEIAQPSAGAAVLKDRALPSLVIGTKEECTAAYSGSLAGWEFSSILNKAHYLSAGMVSFARGLNDTPKIAALILAGSAFSSALSIASVGLLMAIGGLISAKKVAETMSLKITAMSEGQGFSANLVTGFLVIAASKFGMPVSTTHVSVGSLIGIGFATRQAHYQTIAQIMLAWVITLPLAALFGGISFILLKQLF